VWVECEKIIYLTISRVGNGVDLGSFHPGPWSQEYVDRKMQGICVNFQKWVSLEVGQRARFCVVWRRPSAKYRSFNPPAHTAPLYSTGSKSIAMADSMTTPRKNATIWDLACRVCSQTTTDS
jgi:hypothetical protein